MNSQRVEKEAIAEKKKQEEQYKKVLEREKLQRQQREQREKLQSQIPNRQAENFLQGEYDNYEITRRVCDPYSTSNQVYYHDETIDVKAGIFRLLDMIEEKDQIIEELKGELKKLQTKQHH